MVVCDDVLHLVLCFALWSHLGNCVGKCWLCVLHRDVFSLGSSGREPALIISHHPRWASDDHNCVGEKNQTERPLQQVCCPKPIENVFFGSATPKRKETTHLPSTHHGREAFEEDVKQTLPGHFQISQSFLYYPTLGLRGLMKLMLMNRKSTITCLRYHAHAHHIHPPKWRRNRQCNDPICLASFKNIWYQGS